MNHIVTKSEIEAKARVKYAEAKPSVMVADDALAKKVADLLALRKKMDQDELLKSQMMGGNHGADEEGHCPQEQGRSSHRDLEGGELHVQG